MPFAAALSVHPVSSHAAGEVIGQLFETTGPRADLLVILATPGHRGALEDIAATARRLLSPGVLLAAVTTGLGAGDECVERSPGLVAWSGRCGPIAALGAGAPAFEVTGALVLGTGRADATTAHSAGRHVAVATAAVAGPVVVDGTAPGTGTVGVVFGPGSGFATSVAYGLRALGPVLTVTRADGDMVYELDGHPALRRLVDLARDGMPAADLPTFAAGLHLRVTTPGAAALSDPLAVLGADRDNGAIALRGGVETGRSVQFAVADPAAVRAALGPVWSDRSDGAMILTPAGGHLLAGHRQPVDPDLWWDGDDLVDPGPALPASTLVCATGPPEPTARPRPGPRLPSATVAYFAPTN